MEERRKYRVRSGFTFGAFDEYKPGDWLELTPDEAAGFLDKLEEVEADEAIVPLLTQRAGELPVQAEAERAIVESPLQDAIPAVPKLGKRRKGND